ncbi:hypothetical protein FB451DRAFT_1164871 [Mycena latifolia]|nr:hypothetical protein FB451DRAFT_1164871 [Mycena latifolia]
MWRILLDTRPDVASSIGIVEVVVIVGGILWTGGTRRLRLLVPRGNLSLILTPTPIRKWNAGRIKTVVGRRENDRKNEKLNQKKKTLQPNKQSRQNPSFNRCSVRENGKIYE